MLLKKKGDGRRVRDYKGMTLLKTLYKIYTKVLEGRLKKEIEKKKMLPDSQVGFKIGIGTIDIYVLSYMVNKELQREEGKMLAFFVDFKAAFDSIDKEIIMEDAGGKRGKSGVRRKNKGGI